MTIQLELDFTPSYVAQTFLSFHNFVNCVHGSFLRNNYTHKMQQLRREANDTKNYAFLHGYISCETYEFYTNSIIELTDLFWS